MRLTALFPLLLFVPALSAQDQTQDPTGPVQDQSRGLVVTESGIESLTLGGELRARAEVKSNEIPASFTDSSHWNSLRARVQADAKVDEYVRAFVQLQYAVTSAGSASMTDLHQGYLELSELLGDYTVQAGRFEQSYGEGRMVAVDDWRVNPNTFDGIRGSGHYRNLDLNLFLTQAVDGQGASNSGTDFYGVYGVWDLDSFMLDTYAMRKNSPDLPDRDLRAYGARAYGEAFEGLHWDAEAILEEGHANNRDLSAQGYVVHLEYALDGGHHVGVEWSSATGDATAGDNDTSTFRPFFMDTHTWNGIADVVTWSNLVDVAARYWLDWNDRWSFHAELHHFTKEADADGIYPVPGGPAIPDTTSSNIGTELDLFAVGDLTKNFYVSIGGAYFAAGGAVANSDNLLYGYVQLGLRF